MAQRDEVEDDPLGLGLGSHVTYTGYAAGFSSTGIDLRGLLQRPSALAHLSSTSSSTAAPHLASSSAHANVPLPVTQRKKIVADIVDLLSHHRGTLSFDQLFALSSIDLSREAHESLLKDLARNVKIDLRVDCCTIAYKPYFPFIKNSNDILTCVHQHPFGVQEELLCDSYDRCAEDINTLVQTQQIYRIRPHTAATVKAANAEGENPTKAALNNDGLVSTADLANDLTKSRKPQYSLLFPRRRAFELPTPLDPQIVSLWRATQVPSTSADLDDVLIQNSLMPAGKQLAANRTSRQALLAKEAVVRKRKKTDAANLQRKRQRMHLTNTHLMNDETYHFLKNKS